MERDLPSLRLFQVEDRWRDGTNETVVRCPPGKVAVTGGYDIRTNAGGLRGVHQSAPTIQSAAGPPTGWRVTGGYEGPGGADVVVYAACAWPY